MRAGVEAGGFEFVAQAFDERAQHRGVAIKTNQAIHGVDPEADGFHVKRCDGSSKGFGFFHQLIAVAPGGQRPKRREEFVEYGQ